MSAETPKSSTISTSTPAAIASKAAVEETVTHARARGQRLGHRCAGEPDPARLCHALRHHLLPQLLVRQPFTVRLSLTRTGAQLHHRARRLDRREREQHSTPLIACGRDFGLCCEDDVTGPSIPLQPPVGVQERKPSQSDRQPRRHVCSNLPVAATLPAAVHQEQVTAPPQFDGSTARREADAGKAGDQHRPAPAAPP